MERRGFTLIELLVVIAIIAILAAILFPVFAQAKRAAKDAVSLSGVKQLALASVMYSTDNEDTIILHEYANSPYTGWPVFINPYTKSTDILWDPARQDRVAIGAQPWDNTPRINWAWQVHLAMNKDTYASTTGNVNAFIRTQTSFGSPAERIAYAFGEVQNQNSANSQHYFNPQRAACPSVASVPTGRETDWYNQLARAAIKSHGDAVVGAFVDGHAKKTPYKRIMNNQASFSSSATCETTYFYGPDGQYNTADDPDTELTRFWGRFWSGSY